MVIDTQRDLDLAALTRRIRRHIVQMVYDAKSGHIGGSLSAVEIITVLYARIMRHDPQRPDWPERDRFILSKGHACPVLYATLAEQGYLPVEELTTFRALNSRLQGHPRVGTIPGVRKMETFINLASKKEQMGINMETVTV